MKINNLPKYAENYKFIVARRVDGDLWFYSGFNDVDRAIICANEVDGEVIPMSEDCKSCEVNL